jgi:hypothetical protein
MYIDYLGLMLLNPSAGRVMLVLWAISDSFRPEQKRWVRGLPVTGLLGPFTGLHMIFTWPLPGAFKSDPGNPGHGHRPVAGLCRDPHHSQVHSLGDLP